MVEPIHDLDPARIRGNLERVREVTGDKTEILIAVKYVPLEQMEILAEAGVELVGENRQQELEAKRERWGDTFRWDFIGALQSRKVKPLLPLCSRIHSFATESALTKLAAAVAIEPRAAEPGGDGAEESAADNTAATFPEILLQVNVAADPAKAGFEPDQLAAAIRLCPLPVAGLMTMPPAATDPEQSRPYFARLAELAAEHGLSQLSMGTSQDWRVAVEEGATVIRLGGSVLR